jgi:hypothetical protein
MEELRSEPVVLRTIRNTPTVCRWWEPARSGSCTGTNETTSETIGTMGC